MQTDDELLSSVEAADVIGVSRWTLMRLTDEGRISPVKRLRGRTGPKLYSRGDAERLARQMKAEAKA